MERIQNFKSFSTLKTQLREEAENQQKELKRGESVTAFTELLRKYNVSSVSEITEDQLEKFASELFNVSEEEEEQIEEGRAFIFAASKAKKEGKTEFEWNGKKYPVTLKEAEEGKEVSAEEVNEGKKERTNVLKAWVKTGVQDIKAIAKLYADAMEDANFHQEIVTAKAIGAASQAKKADLNGAKGSIIAGAAGWDGYAIANGTVDFLREIGAEEAANKLYGAISKFDLNESINLNSLEEIIEEGTRGQFGKIYKSGEIASVYTHYDSYPENMLPTIKKGYKKGTDVDAILGKGDNSGLEADPSKMKFYGDPRSLKPTMGNVKNLKKYISDADGQGAEYIYLFDERNQKWYMVDVYGDRELKPAFESVVNEGKFKVDDLVYNKRTKTVGIVRMGDDKYGEVKTDADGNVSVDELEKYNPIKFKHQTKAKVAPSTEKEVNSRGLFNPFKAESVVNEAEVDIMDEVGGDIHNIYGKLNDLAEETTDSAWRKAIESIIKGLEGVESKIGQTAKKLGVVPTHESEEVEEDVIPGGLSDDMTPQQIADKHGVDISEIEAALVKGVKVEMEHTDDEKIAHEVAMDHLFEDPKYYDKLADMEKESIEVEEGNAFGDAVRKAKEAGEEEFEFDGKTYKVEESAKDEQKAMELYVQLVDLKKGKHSEAELKGMSDEELFNLVQDEGGLRGNDAKAVAKELAKIAK